MATKKDLAEALGDDEPTEEKSRRPPTRGAKGSKTAPSTPAAADEPPTPDKPHVLVPKADHAKRAGLYLHPDDYKALGLAKLEDGADYNARIRAMIAIWRHNPRFRSQVDKLAKTAPRGPYSGRK
jgi:hypothetical protein